MRNPRRKIFFSIMGFTILVATGYLFIFIEERKYEALYYKTELEKLQQQNGAILLQQMAEQAKSGTALAVVRQSSRIAALSDAEISEIVSTLKESASTEQRNTLAKRYSLSESEIAAINALLQTTAQ